MNPSSNDTDSLRSDIDLTRKRMDDTMDALGDRLQPRHLVDELVGFFRGNGNGGDSRLKSVCDKVTDSANAAAHSVVATVKKNPVPALLIGAGVAWMIYESRRTRNSRDYDGDYSSRRADDDAVRYDPDRHYDRPLQYPTGAEIEAGTEWGREGGSEFSEMREGVGEKISAAGEQVREKISHAGEAARAKIGTMREQAGEKFRAVKERAGEVGQRVKEGTREAYVRTREGVVRTADQHPIEVGLASLAVGLIAGLLLPTPNVVNRTVGPAADRLRARTREAGTEMLEKGKRVAQAAVGAVKAEAQAQGLTPERLREKATAVAERATEAGKQSAQREGLPFSNGGAADSSVFETSDPSLTRPTV